MMSTGLFIFAFLAGWLAALSGVALGGFLVYRTKRDSYDPLFRAPGKSGDAFNLEDGFNLENEAPARTKIPQPTMKANSKFTDQFADKLAEKIASGE